MHDLDVALQREIRARRAWQGWAWALWLVAIFEFVLLVLWRSS
jgi:hypothetical protein